MTKQTALLLLAVLSVTIICFGCTSSEIAESTVTDQALSTSSVESAPELVQSSNIGESSISTKDSCEESLVERSYAKEEIEGLRLSVSYPGVNYIFTDEHNESPFKLDSLGEKIQLFLSNADFGSPPENSFNSTNEIPYNFVRYAVLFNTRAYNWWNTDDKLHPLGIVNGKFTIARGLLKEHMEATAKHFFGEDYLFEPKGIISEDEYCVANGIYDGANLIPLEMYEYYASVVLSYEEFDDRYEVAVVYPYKVHDQWAKYPEKYREGLATTQDDFIYGDKQELADHCLTLPKHKIILLKREDGGFVYYSHILPEDIE